MKATLRIPEFKIFAVKPGMLVFLQFDALPGEEFDGSIARVDPYVDPATRTSSVEVELDNNAADFRLRPGMFGRVHIVEREYRNAVVLPDNALRANETGFYVLVEEGGVAKQRNVSTGIRQGASVQIIGGLEPGDRVIVFGGNNLSDGENVTVQ